MLFQTWQSRKTRIRGVSEIWGDQLKAKVQLKANLYSVSVGSFPRQHYLPFQLFGSLRIISQHDEESGGFFSLSFCTRLEVFLMMMVSTGTNIRYPRQHRGYQNQ
jgi:hypothetical protein